MKHDVLYAEPRSEVAAFAFDDQVVAVFPDMIQRSVPGYSEILRFIALMAEQYASPASRIYDLGCSLGAATLAIRTYVDPSCRMIAVDNSTAMLEKCRAALTHHNAEDMIAPVDLICADIEDVMIENASVVVLNFTLQFIPLARRLPLLQRVWQGMRSGGVLILSEKVVFADAETEKFMTRMHERFKHDQGYSHLEVSQKRAALEKVLVPETWTVHQQRLQAAGFDHCAQWFQCMNFTSWVAHKQ
ncbi:MAG: carboxy-S-adenosyl-L-methionine synthase CmoA [Mariprofundaceae bacterium]